MCGLCAQAYARLGLVPSLLPVCLPAVTPAAAFSMPKQHLCCDMHSQELELPVLPPLPAYVAQHSPGHQVQAALALVVKLPKPEPIPLQLCDMDTFMAEHFACRMAVPELQHEAGVSYQPSLDVRSRSAAPVSGVCPADTCFIEPMLLPPFMTAAEVRNSVAAEAFAACMPLDAPASDPKQALAELAGGVTFDDPLSADQVLPAVHAVMYALPVRAPTSMLSHVNTHGGYP